MNFFAFAAIFVVCSVVGGLVGLYVAFAILPPSYDPFGDGLFVGGLFGAAWGLWIVMKYVKDEDNEEGWRR